MAKSIYHSASSRGQANHGWLNSFHTFSFASYYNETRMHFGALRVLNDDTVMAGAGFGTHPHDNMEIISVPLKGELLHRDSMGNEQRIRKGEIQVMSAGSGITHSEMNANNHEEVKFLQIWIFPNKRNVTPRYDQKEIGIENIFNEWKLILSPDKSENCVWIHQNAWFSFGKFETDKISTYKLNSSQNGVYVFVLSGSIFANEQLLNARDGYGLWELNEIDFKAADNCEVLLMEVPMM